MYLQMIEDADIVSRFCRYQLTSKRNLPIRSSEMGLLVFVSKQEEYVSPLAISEFFKIAKPTVTGMVKRMIKANYLLKISSPNDHRSYRLLMTPLGRDLVEKALNDYLSSIEQLRIRLGKEDYQCLVSLLNKANKVLDMENSK